MLIDMTDKQLIMETLGGLPESASWEQIQEEFSILAAIKEGERAADAGELVPHEEAVKLVESWATKYAGQSQR
jgi:predicted transcriptional regulator